MSLVQSTYPSPTAKSQGTSHELLALIPSETKICMIQMDIESGFAKTPHMKAVT
jgi:hypothetical protein